MGILKLVEVSENFREQVLDYKDEFDNNNGILIRERHEALGTQEILGYVKF